MAKLSVAKSSFNRFF